MPYLMGIDVSTTGVKVLLVNPSGKIIASASTEHPLQTPKPLWSEQDPSDWWKGALAGIRQVLAQTNLKGDQVAGIGLTGQMHGLTLLDSHGKVLRPAILWNDQRTAEQCDEIRSLVGRQRLIEITGNDALTGFTAPKILWVREHEPRVYANIRHILLPKDYVRYRLTGDFAVDRADGAGTILFDLRQRDWSPEILKALNIPLEWLPKTFEGCAVTGHITPEAAHETGLKAGTPVVGGGGDQAAQAVGVGAVSPGIIALTLGTSGVVFAPTPDPFIEPDGRLHAFCHSLPARWHLMGVMLSAAGSLRWFRDTFTPGKDFDTLLAPAAAVIAGSEGLLFLPYLTGERTPHPDPLARGSFTGLTIRHSLPHLTRAVLEGVAFGLRDSFELIKSAGLAEIRQVRVSGGGARSPLWRQILANVFDSELVTVNTTEGAAFGAALLAGVGSGIWTDVDQACQAAVQITGSTTPQPRDVKTYDHYYSLYGELYPLTKDLMHKLN